MHAVIETVDLRRRFGQLDAVEGLNLQVSAGSLFAFVGPNGAGKTTTIKMLLNLLKPTSGKAVVLGTDSRQLGPRELQRLARCRCGTFSRGMRMKAALAYGVPMPHVASVAAQTTLFWALWLSIVMTFAALTSNMAKFALAAGGVVVAFIVSITIAVAIAIDRFDDAPPISTAGEIIANFPIRTE